MQFTSDPVLVSTAITKELLMTTNCQEASVQFEKQSHLKTLLLGDYLGLEESTSPHSHSQPVRWPQAVL